MNDAKTAPQEPAKAGVIEMLERLPDAELQDVIKRGQAILKEREAERRRDALREIQRLAKEHGIKVDVGQGKRRRGRPPKAKGEA